MSEKIQRQYEKILCIGFIGFISVFFLFSWFLPDKFFSAEENRVLQQRPSFSWQQLYDGKLTANWDKYVSDQFPGRNLWISGKSSLQKFWGQKDINGVYLGEKGYLLQKLDPPTTENMIANLEAITAFAENHPNYHIAMALVPTSTAVLADLLPKYAQPVDERAIISQVENALPDKISFLSLYSALEQYKEEPIYYRTDHHWTTLGAYYGYVALGELLGYTPYSLEDFIQEEVSKEFYGTLYAKGNFSFIEPDTINLFLPKDALNKPVKMTVMDDGTVYDSLYLMEKLQERDQYSVFLGGNHAYVKIETQAGTGKTLHLIKDSFSHCLIPFLALHYDEIHVYDLRYFRYPFNQFLDEKQAQDFLILYNTASYIKEGTIKDLKYK